MTSEALSAPVVAHGDGTFLLDGSMVVSLSQKKN